ncbi:MAG: hypothetical protein KAH01_07640 [Caldisericia bacterium]|nr:hypothetical protein [Caldisericia bacterium]
MSYLSTENYNEMIRLQKMVDELDALLKHANKTSGLMSFCDGINTKYDCRKTCVFNLHTCPVGLAFPAPWKLEELRKVVVSKMDRIDPEWRESHSKKIGGEWDCAMRGLKAGLESENKELNEAIKKTEWRNK